MCMYVLCNSYRMPMKAILYTCKCIYNYMGVSCRHSIESCEANDIITIEHLLQIVVTLIIQKCMYICTYVNTL